jgi:hypothetical protein
LFDFRLGPAGIAFGAVLRRRTIAVAWPAALFFCSAIAAKAASLEYAVKAAFIYKFPLYVQWPSNAGQAANAPFSICIAGQDPVGELLDQGASGQHVNAQPIVLRHVKALAHDASCNVVYIAESNPDAVSEDIATLRGLPVLTITDSDRTPGVVGMISFTLQNHHVRFDVDNAAAASSGLIVSSELLGLAHAVKQKE